MMRFEEIEPGINRICNSRYFTSPTDSRLLKYLVDATFNGNVLKESVIAVEIFNRAPTFNPGDDSIVRSSIYNLRKKLDLYYLEEGKTDSFRVSIPKGSYQVVFEYQDSVAAAIKKPEGSRGSSYLLWASGFLFVSTFLLIILYINQRQNLQKLENPVSTNYFWSDIVLSQKPLLIVLGDYFMIEKVQPKDSTHSFERNPAVNSPEDFIAYRDKNPEMKNQMKAFGMSYFGEEIPWCLLELFKIFKSSSKPVSVKYSSELSLSDIRENDIIFFGDFSTITVLKSFLGQTHYRFSLSPPTLYYAENFIDTTETISISNRLETDFQNDYAIVSKITGYADNKIMLFLSFSPFGKTEAINKLTDPSFIDELNRININRPQNWDMLFKVSGLGTSGFYYELLRFDSLDK